MYYPWIRGKQYDLMAIRELSESLVNADCICPIIEPVNHTASAVNSFEAFAEAGMHFVMVVNPIVGELANKHKKVKEHIVDQCLDECDTFTPGIVVNSSSTVSDLKKMSIPYRDYYKAYLYDFEPRDKALVDFIVSQDDISYHVFFSHRPAQPLRDMLPPEKKILISDNFNKQVKNASYASIADEFFSDSHLSYPSKDYHGYGDYSVVGRDYSEKGWAVYAVALHHLYIDSNRNNGMYLRHYVSDRVDTIQDPSGKFLEALAKLVSDIPSLGAHNETETVLKYRELFNEKRSPGLGVAKKLAIKHHLELIMKCEI